ncbi:MAG: lipopolysaccharide biosynthesis protein [Saprospiraceae bacterium]
MTAIIQKIKAYSSTILALTDQAVVSGSNFLIGIVLARVLGIDGYGLFALLWMIVLFGKSINQAFVTRPMMSLAPKKETKEATNYLATLHYLQYLTSFGIGVFVFVFLLFGQYFDIKIADNRWFWVVPSIVFLHLIYDFYRSQSFVKQDVVFALILDIILFGGHFVAIFVLWYYENLSVTNALIGIGIAHLAVVVLGFFKYLQFNFNTNVLKETIIYHFNFSKWLIGTALLQWFSGNFFIIVAAALMSEAAVGAIRIVQNVMGLTHVLFLAMENIVPVKAALHFKEGGIKQLKTYLIYITGRAGILVGAVLLFLAVFRTFIIDFLYGAEYIEYSYLVIGFCLTYVLVFIGHPLRFALMTLEITKPIFVSYVLGAIFSLILAYPLVGQFGLVGVLIGIFVTQGLSQLVYVYYLRKYTSS